jgi:hypothetical protein
VFESDFSALDGPRPTKAGDAGPSSNRRSSRDLVDEAERSASNWVDPGTGPSFGVVGAAAATAILGEPARSESSSLLPKDAAFVETDRQPALQPIAHEDLPSSGVLSDISRARSASSMAKPILVGLVMATLVVLVAVIVVFVNTRSKRLTTTSVTEVAFPDGVLSEPASAVVVGSEIAPTTAETDASVSPAQPDPTETPRSASRSRKAARRSRNGYVSIKANNVSAAKVYIDGRFIRYSPLVNHKLRAGKHRIKVIEDKEGGGRSKVFDVVVGAANTRKKPLRLFINL